MIAHLSIDLSLRANIQCEQCCLTHKQMTLSRNCSKRVGGLNQSESFSEWAGWIRAVTEPTSNSLNELNYLYSQYWACVGMMAQPLLFNVRSDARAFQCLARAVTHFLTGRLNTGLLSDHHVLLWISKVDRRGTIPQVAGATLIRFCMWTLVICILNKGFAFCWHCWRWTERQQKCGRTWWEEEQLSWFALSHVTVQHREHQWTPTSSATLFLDIFFPLLLFPFWFQKSSTRS